MLWSEQFYCYVVPDWINGDSKRPLAPEVRERRINREWPHLFSRDVLSVPDKWEYPAFFAWDLAFHMIPMCRVDPDFAKKQLLLLLREWYLHPNGQLPAFEYDFSNVNPPVHAWACWQVFKRTGGTIHVFLEKAFHKLLMNFTWWVNRKDPEGRNVFSGGFLGMDNLGVFDRSRPLPTGGQLEQADGTAWMGFYCTSMLRIALELALHHNRAYEDIASKFLEHFMFISDSLNNLGGRGLWDDADGFYYDQLLLNGQSTPLKLRALIGLIPLLAVQVLENEDDIRPNLPDFHGRTFEWFLSNRKDLISRASAEIEVQGHRAALAAAWLLSLPGRKRLERALRYLLDESEFLSPYGIRSLSRTYKDRPYVFRATRATFTNTPVAYVPGDMDNQDFGGNSNWRGPIWLPINFLLIEALREYDRFYGNSFQIECPTGSGKMTNLNGVALELAERLGSLFVPQAGRPRPCLTAPSAKYARTTRTGVTTSSSTSTSTGTPAAGCGASHQTGWTAAGRLPAGGLRPADRYSDRQESFCPMRYNSTLEPTRNDRDETPLAEDLAASFRKSPGKRAAKSGPATLRISSCFGILLMVLVFLLAGGHFAAQQQPPLPQKALAPASRSPPTRRGGDSRSTMAAHRTGRV